MLRRRASDLPSRRAHSSATTSSHIYHRPRSIRTLEGQLLPFTNCLIRPRYHMSAIRRTRRRHSRISSTVRRPWSESRFAAPSIITEPSLPAVHALQMKTHTKPALSIFLHSQSDLQHRSPSGDPITQVPHPTRASRERQTPRMETRKYSILESLTDMADPSVVLSCRKIFTNISRTQRQISSYNRVSGQTNNGKRQHPQARLVLCQ